MSDGSRQRSVMLYDSDCAMCTAGSRWVRRLDWFHRIDTVPLQDPVAVGLAPGLTKEALHRAMHVVAPGKEVHVGARALRHAGLRLPLLLPLALLLWIPGMMWLADPAYTFVAKRRRHLNRFYGCDGACEIHWDED